MYGVRYTLPEYLCTFLVAGGVSMFALFKVHSTKSYSCLVYLLQDEASMAECVMQVPLTCFGICSFLV